MDSIAWCMLRPGRKENCAWSRILCFTSRAPRRLASTLFMTRPMMGLTVIGRMQSVLFSGPSDFGRPVRRPYFSLGGMSPDWKDSATIIRSRFTARSAVYVLLYVWGMGLVCGVMPCASSHWWRRVSLLRRFFPFLVGTVQEVLAVSLMRRGESSHAEALLSRSLIVLWISSSDGSSDSMSLRCGLTSRGDEEVSVWLLYGWCAASGMCSGLPASDFR